MNKVILYIMLLIGLWGCNNEDDISTSRTRIKLRMVDNDTVSTRAMTEYTTANISEIGLYVWQNTTDYNYENSKLGKTGVYWEVKDGGEILYWDDEVSGSTATLVAYAPYCYSPDDQGYIYMSVQDEFQDFLYGVKTVDIDAVVASGGAVTMQMSHILSKVIVKFESSSSVLAHQNLTGCEIKDVYYSMKLNVRDGSIEILPDKYNLPMDVVSGQCVGYFIPQASKVMTIGLNGVKYDIDLPNCIASFESGKTYTFTVKVGADYVQLAEDFDVTVDYWLPGLSSATDISAKIIYSDGTLWAADAEALKSYVNEAVGATVSDTLKKATKLIVRGTPSDSEWEFIANLGQNLVTQKAGPMPNLVEVKFPEITSVPNVWFGTMSNGSIIGARWLKSFSAPNATVLEDYALRGCYSLVSVDLPKVEKIGYAAFRYCLNLGDVYFKNVKEIGSNAFFHCPSLKTVYFPNAEVIGDSCFLAKISNNSNHANGDYTEDEYCLENVYFPKLKSIGRRAFCYTPLKQVSFPSVETIGEGAFQGMKQLNSISFDAVTDIGNNAFAECPLRYVSLGGDKTTLHNNVFTSGEVNNALLRLKTSSTNYGNITGTKKWGGYTWGSILEYVP